MGDDDWLVLSLNAVAVLSRQHVDLALIHAQLAYICLKEENIGALHAGVQDI